MYPVSFVMAWRNWISANYIQNGQNKNSTADTERIRVLRFNLNINKSKLTSIQIGVFQTVIRKIVF